MRKMGILAMVMLGVLLFAFPASAVVIALDGGDGLGTGLQAQLNNITLGPNPGVSSVNVNSADQISTTFDNYWTLTASGGSVTTFVVAVAGNANQNEFGIFYGNVFVPIFTGLVNGGGGPATGLKTVSIVSGEVYINGFDTLKNIGGKVFGYYLKGPGGLFYSDDSLNPSGAQQMVAFQGKDIDTIQIPGFDSGLWISNEYLLGWEDLPYFNGSDHDYQDLVVMVESVKPIPEPGTMMLLGSGLVGLAGWGRKKFRK